MTSDDDHADVRAQACETTQRDYPVPSEHAPRKYDDWDDGTFLVGEEENPRAWIRAHNDAGVVSVVDWEVIEDA